MAASMVPSGQFQCFSNIVDHESSWNYRAVNASSGAYGLFQALPGSKMSSVGSDWQTNPATQIKWGLNYMDSRYGSPCEAWSFWQANRRYSAPGGSRPVSQPCAAPPRPRGRGFRHVRSDATTPGGSGGQRRG